MSENLRDTPKRLFKYFGPDRSDVLLTRFLRFTPLGEFNDPFEGRPHVTGLATESMVQDIFEEELPKQLELAYENLPAEARAMMSRDQFLAIALPKLLEEMPALHEGFKMLSGNLVREMPAKLDQAMAALCLSEVPDSLLMWAHYGASHTGFALEFDGHHPYFHQRLSEKDELRHIRRVLYRDARPTGAMVDFEGSDVFLVKSSHWSYEREWRMFMPTAHADEIVDNGAGKIHLFRIPADAIIAVILGARASQQLVETVRQVLSNSADLKHVRISSCFADEAQFVLRIT